MDKPTTPTRSIIGNLLRIDAFSDANYQFGKLPPSAAVASVITGFGVSKMLAIAHLLDRAGGLRGQPLSLPKIKSERIGGAILRGWA
jgi:hypothetical protein